MNPTFSLASLLLVTTLIAGWLGLCRVAADLAVVFTLISGLALVRTMYASSRYEASQIRLSILDKIALFLSSQSVVIASFIVPIGTFVLFSWPTDFVHRSRELRYLADAIIAVLLAFATVLSLVSIRIIIRHLWPIDIANGAPRRRLAVATGLPVAFFVGCALDFYGTRPFLTALFEGRPALFPSLIGLSIAVPASIFALASMNDLRHTGRPASNLYALLALLRAAAWMTGTAAVSAGSGFAVFWAFDRIPGLVYSSVLDPAVSISCAAMAWIFLAQRLFETLAHAHRPEAALVR